MAASMKNVFGLITFVTAGMIIVAFFQLAFIQKLENSHGISHWENDKEVDNLRIGYVCLLLSGLRLP
ncbi:hypothetical protein OIU77_010941 [Salix suchowensis]|uniref:Uncharacterized protein n=1 Tax=Salix suchowensis TaxID=1278906 RepID=A0ABQ9AB18_9ROSI|nr:hypothetical protein OIU77_010941 [Salix suchowensis]